MKGVKYLFSFVLLFSGQFAYAQLAGDYRVNQNVICSDTVNLMVTYDLNLAKDSSFTVSGNGTYIPPYTTFKFECAGTWAQYQRQAPFDQPMCDLIDLAIYQSGASVGPLPRALTAYINNSI